MADEDKRIPRIPLPANSFDLGALDKAIAGAVKGKEADRPTKIAEAVRSSANLGDVLDGQDRVALPEGTEMAKVETQAGQTVEAPISKPADAKSGAEAASQELESTAEVQRAAESGQGDRGEAAPETK